MAAKLKTFVMDDGLYTHVVATSSRVKALRAWGANQDLFKAGLAKETGDPALVKAATAHPETPLRRKAGASGGRFVAE